MYLIVVLWHLRIFYSYNGGHHIMGGGNRSNLEIPWMRIRLNVRHVWSEDWKARSIHGAILNAILNMHAYEWVWVVSEIRRLVYMQIKLTNDFSPIHPRVWPVIQGLRQNVLCGTVFVYLSVCVRVRAITLSFNICCKHTCTHRDVSRLTFLNIPCCHGYLIDIV